MIAASIVTYHTATDELAHCLDCLTASALVSRIDVIDNGQEARIEQFIANHYPAINYIAADNRGFGAGHNISMRRSLESGTSFHLVVNSDISFIPDIPDRLVDKMDADKSIALISPATTFPDGSPQSNCHPLPSPLDLLLHRFAPKSMFKNWRAGYDLYPIRIGKDLNVPYIHGCFMLMRTSALGQSGLFDERFFMYPEDIDLTRRLHERYKTVVTPEVSIIHAHRAASRHNTRMLRIHASNMLKYFAKWGFFFDSKRRLFNSRLRREL